MAQNTTAAPWAEEVPGAPYPMTVDNLLALPRDADWRYELVDGRLIRMPGSGWEATGIAARMPAPGSPDYEKAPRLAPDLVAEVVSPSQYHPGMNAKALLHLAAGVRFVWRVCPKQREVEVWRSGAATPVTTLGFGDALDGLDVVPGFVYPLANLFAH